MQQQQKKVHHFYIEIFYYFQKATAQLAKTVLSIPTHLRNLISAGAFAAANGILFEGFLNPKLLGQSFRRGWQISGVGN